MSTNRVNLDVSSMILKVEHHENPKQMGSVFYLKHHGWKTLRQLQAKYIWSHRNDLSLWLNGGHLWMRSPYRIFKLPNGIRAYELIENIFYKSYTLTFE